MTTSYLGLMCADGAVSTSQMLILLLLQLLGIIHSCIGITGIMNGKRH